MSAFVRGVLLVAAFIVSFLVLAPWAWGEDSEPPEAPQTALESPVPADQWSPEVRLWLARSVVGEVGWGRMGEQAAVAWVYAVRAEMSSQHTFIQMVKSYSAAIKLSGKRRNPWLFELDETGARPKSWPVTVKLSDGRIFGPRWKGVHDQSWLKTLEMVDSWQAGKVPNPCKGANHFGGYVDRHRAENLGWKRVKCGVKTRNRFYNSHIIVRRPRG